MLPKKSKRTLGLREEPSAKWLHGDKTDVPILAAFGQCEIAKIRDAAQRVLQRIVQPGIYGRGGTIKAVVRDPNEARFPFVLRLQQTGIGRVWIGRVRKRTGIVQLKHIYVVHTQTAQARFDISDNPFAGLRSALCGDDDAITCITQSDT